MVVFPAPLGPRRPMTLPLGIAKEMSSTALNRPKSFVRWCTSSSGPVDGVSRPDLRAMVSAGGSARPFERVGLSMLPTVPITPHNLQARAAERINSTRDAPALSPALNGMVRPLRRCSPEALPAPAGDSPKRGRGRASAAGFPPGVAGFWACPFCRLRRCAPAEGVCLRTRSPVQTVAGAPCVSRTLAAPPCGRGQNQALTCTGTGPPSGHNDPPGEGGLRADNGIGPRRKPAVSRRPSPTKRRTIPR